MPANTEGQLINRADDQTGNKIVDNIVGGWETSGILSLQSGRPFTVLLARDNANVLNTVDRPNVVGDPYQAGGVAANPTCNAPAQVGTPSFWINPCAFVAAPAIGMLLYGLDPRLPFVAGVVLLLALAAWARARL